ncbi:MAG: putative serine/threonine protein phosphatase [Ilumatobacteraceae bacterium]|nr:putative serine/threonine protein phosphatase [Ilumatobacteraceae bacterium]
MPELRWGATTNPGRVRSENEDTFVAEPMVFAVADGMGGHQAGEVASALAASIIRDRLANGSVNEDYAVAVVNEVNAAIHGAARVDATKSGMGTTLTALAVLNAQGDQPEQLVLLNVGDSRTYRFRLGRLQRVTVDHSYVQELVATGHITMEEARTHPRRNIVTRALGIEPNVRTDMWTLPIVRGDRFVLCSDGLVDEVPDEEILDLVASIEDPQTLSQQLVDLANRHGGRDNVTVVVLDVLEGAEPPDPTGEMQVDPSWATTGGPLWEPNTLAPPTAPSGDGSASTGTMSDAATGASFIASRDPSTMPTMPPPAAPLPGAAPEVADAPIPAPTLPAAASMQAVKDPMPAPQPGSTPEPMPAPKTVSSKPRRRRLTGGLALFIVVLAAIVIVTVTLISVHERSGYYVGFKGDTVVVYKGQPEGFLWFHPTVNQVTALDRNSLPAAAIAQIEQHVVFDTVDEAVTNLQLVAPPTTTTTVVVTTTSVAATTTVPTTGATATSTPETTTTVPSGP